MTDDTREPITRITIEGSERDGWWGLVERKEWLGPWHWTDYRPITRLGYSTNATDVIEEAKELAEIRS